MRVVEKLSTFRMRLRTFDDDGFCLFLCVFSYAGKIVQAITKILIICG